MSLIALLIFNCSGCLPLTQYMVQPSPTFLLFSRNSMTWFHLSLLQPYLQNHPFCQGKLIYTVVSKHHTTLQISKIMIFIACHSTQTVHVHVDILVGCYTECYKLSLASGDVCSLHVCTQSGLSYRKQSKSLWISAALYILWAAWLVYTTTCCMGLPFLIVSCNHSHWNAQLLGTGYTYGNMFLPCACTV